MSKLNTPVSRTEQNSYLQVDTCSERLKDNRIKQSILNNRVNTV